jgi:hypothetical protein
MCLIIKKLAGGQKLSLTLEHSVKHYKIKLSRFTFSANFALERLNVRVIHHVDLKLLPTLGLEAAHIALHVVFLLLLAFLKGAWNGNS